MAWKLLLIGAITTQLSGGTGLPGTIGVEVAKQDFPSRQDCLTEAMTRNKAGIESYAEYEKADRALLMAPYNEMEKKIRSEKRGFSSSEYQRIQAEKKAIEEKLTPHVVEVAICANLDSFKQ